MKVYQWSTIMWILCMVCYYVSDKELGPLIAAFTFLLFGAIYAIFMPKE